MLCAASMAMAGTEGRKYTADFEDGLPHDKNAAWSEQTITKTPSGRVFLGPFSNKAAALTLTDLPAHRMAMVSFDLYVIGPWDGQSGPRHSVTSGDTFACRIVDGQQLLRSTFAVARPGQVLRQSYPREVTGFSGESAAGTGASEQGTLGYESGGEPMDNVYQMRFRVVHSSKTISIEFSGLGLDEATEQWGIDNVEVVLIDDDNPTGDLADLLITDDTANGFTDGENGADDEVVPYGGSGGFLGSNPVGFVPGGSDYPFMPSGGGSSSQNQSNPFVNTAPETNSNNNTPPETPAVPDPPATDPGETNTTPPPPPPPEDPEETDNNTPPPPPPPPTPAPGTLMVALGAGAALCRRRR